jgi:acetyltransferase-like isoleucine patch superfamily enzyme
MVERTASSGHPSGLIETIFDDFLARLEEKLADPRFDRNEIVRDLLYELYLTEAPNFQRLNDYTFPIAARAVIACLDPRNVTLEIEASPELDRQKYAERKPLIWLWQMLDSSPVGWNVHLALRLRRILAPYIFARVGANFVCHQGVRWSCGYNIAIGDNVTIQSNVVLDDRGTIEIGDDVCVENGAHISAAPSGGVTRIGRGVRIGARALVLAGACLPEGTVIPPAGIAGP